MKSNNFTAPFPWKLGLKITFEACRYKQAGVKEQGPGAYRPKFSCASAPALQCDLKEDPPFLGLSFPNMHQ